MVDEPVLEEPVVEDTQISITPPSELAIPEESEHKDLPLETDSTPTSVNNVADLSDTGPTPAAPEPKEELVGPTPAEAPVQPSTPSTTETKIIKSAFQGKRVIIKVATSISLPELLVQ